MARVDAIDADIAALEAKVEEQMGPFRDHGGGTGTDKGVDESQHAGQRRGGCLPGEHARLALGESWPGTAAELKRHLQGPRHAS